MSFAEELRYKSLNYSIVSVLNRIKNGGIVVHSDFKDSKNWSRKKQSLFIETVILGIPIQPIWCEETEFGKYTVIDGAERLRAIQEFYDGKFTLEKLKIHKKYENLSFRELPYYAILGIEDRYLMPFVIMNYDVNPLLKCEFYRRLNSSDKNSSSQEARNFACRNALSHLRDISQIAEKYVNFVPTIDRPASLIDRRRDSQIDEIFLMLLLFIAIRDEEDDGKMFFSSETIEDRLDRFMVDINDMTNDSSYKKKKLLNYLVEICKNNTKPIVVGFGPRLSFSDGNNFVLSEFYQCFLDAMNGEIPVKVNLNQNVFRSGNLYSRLARKVWRIER